MVNSYMFFYHFENYGNDTAALSSVPSAAMGPTADAMLLKHLFKYDI